METIKLKRVFYFNQGQTDIPLNDPSDKFTPEAVKDHYARIYPALTNANISGPVINDDEMQFRFEAVIGKKG